MQSTDLNILIERNIPFIKGLLEPYARVSYLSPEAFTPDAVSDADALIVRTRTRCDETLLSGSRVSFIATATIGTDHIDIPWCEAHGITVANAPGCNAPAVAQYVLSSVIRLADRPLDRYTLAVIGVGHVGKIVEAWARQLGMKVLINDPPRQQAEGGDQWSTLQDIAREADIITVHTPMDATTHHLIDSDFLKQLRKRPVIINAARGPVVDNQALVAALDSGLVRQAVIDCWEGEPSISDALLQRAAVATPHIAGYSYEGKVRATSMAIDALVRHFGLPEVKVTETVPSGAAVSVTAENIAISYDPLVDTAALKADASAFESLRNNYDLRHEVR